MFLHGFRFAAGVAANDAEEMRRYEQNLRDVMTGPSRMTRGAPSPRRAMQAARLS
jgi:hypothetical protein